jgi:chromosome segregation ATPase
MVEPLMYAGIGFLAASLLAIIIIPLIHNRAVRLTMRRLEASTPLSMAEIQADKDQLRAEFAMSTRRLEMSVEQMKAKTTSQLAELGKKNDAINRLKAELGEKTATIFALEAREKALKEQLRATEEEYAIKTSSLHDAELSLQDKQALLTRLNSDVVERTATADSQRVEIISLKTQVEALKVRIGDYEREIKETEARLDRERRDLAQATKELADERGKVENLGRRVGQLEQQLAVQIGEAEILTRRVEELQQRIAEQNAALQEREREYVQLRSQFDAARQVEFDLRSEIAAANDRHSAATSNLRAEKDMLQKQLDQVQGERTKLQHEIAALKREAEATWAAERVENALLRERINDVAAEIARMTAVLEGPDSPIESILSGEAAASPRAAAAAHGSNGETTGIKSLDQSAKGNLAERMRALQSRASRLAPRAT